MFPLFMMVAIGQQMLRLLGYRNDILYSVFIAAVMTIYTAKFMNFKRFFINPISLTWRL